MATDKIIYQMILLFGIFGKIVSCPERCTCNKEFYTDCKFLEMTTDELKNMSSLIQNNTKTLNLLRNNLAFFPVNNLSHLVNLEHLILSHNSLKTVPEDLSKFFPKLETLLLTSNLISDLTTLNGLQNIKTLNLDKNLLTKIPNNAFSNFENLDKLSIQRNRITSIGEDSLDGLSKLKRLHLNGNGIEFVHTLAFENLENLEVFHLQSNKLKQLSPQTFRKQEKLKTLYLYENQIEFLHPVLFHGLPLQELDLNTNNIEYIPHDLLKLEETLQQIYLYNNPFKCTCKLIGSISEFMEYIKGKSIKNNFGDCNLQNSSTKTKVESLTKESLNCTTCDLAYCPNDTRCEEIIDSAKTYGKCVPLPTTAPSTTTKRATQTTTLSTKIEKLENNSSTRNNTTTKTTTQTTTLSTKTEKLENNSSNRNNTNVKNDKPSVNIKPVSKSTSKNTLLIILVTLISVLLIVVCMIMVTVWYRRRKQTFVMENSVYLDDVASEATSLNGTIKLASLKRKRNSLSNSIEFFHGMGSE